jgi:hypothetical protein
LPPVLHALITVFAAAVEEEESSKTLFYLAGGLLAAFAVVVSAVGITRRETFPSGQGQARGVMALAAVLVLFAMAAAVITG